MLGNRLQSGSAHPIGSEISTIQPNRRVPIVWAVELAALALLKVVELNCSFYHILRKLLTQNLTPKTAKEEFGVRVPVRSSILAGE
jgi:hypothetical protein